MTGLCLIQISLWRWLLFPLIMLTGCSYPSLEPVVNQDIKADLSDDPKTCINGIKYLPYTNGTVQAFTSEGQVITCQSRLTAK